MPLHSDMPTETGRADSIEKAKEYLGGKRYCIVTYGCQMNEYDSGKMAGILNSLEMTASDTPEAADLVLVNTCCVREHAENRVYGNVGALINIKRNKPGMLIGVCGCMMQQEQAASRLLARLRHVDLVFGTGNLNELPDMLVRAIESGKPHVRVAKSIGCVPEGISSAERKGVSAFVAIMHGCNNFCSYCIVPYVRGRETSREPERIVEEIRNLTASGVREVTLLGQNVNSYGSGSVDFPALLQTIANEAEGLYRVRFMTSHPKDLSQKLIDTMASTGIVCKQIHLPVQSGSDRILRQMNRNYTAEHYLGLISSLRSAMPGIGITSDFIVGFPGETEEDFADTLALARAARLNASFTFKYSKRAGTPAAKMDDQIAEDVKKERLARLNALQAEITAELDRQAVGNVQAVLVESRAKRRAGQVSGRTDSGRMVSFDGSEELIGRLANVKITKALANSLLGELA